jgi:glycosyltransferase involved in cell wall biosynthesis
MSSVSVVIPCYDYARYLRGCVESVLSQQGVDVRVLVIDDCSPDDTAAVGERLASEDRRVEFCRHAVNQRHIATYNEGLAWAAGDYTLLLSADDLLTPGSLARSARLLDTHPEVGLVYGRQILFSTEEPSTAGLPIRDDDGYRLVDGPSFVAQLCTSGSNPVNTPTAVVRTRLLAEVGGYRPDLPHTADMEFWLRCALRGSVGVLEAEQAFKRMHGQNMQVEYTAGVLRDIEGRMAAVDVFLGHSGHQVADCDRLHAAARNTLGEEAFWAASKAFDRGDRARCEELLAYALKLAPGLTSRPVWSRFRWKRRLGPRLWSWLRPLADRLRRRPAPQNTP